MASPPLSLDMLSLTIRDTPAKISVPLACRRLSDYLCQPRGDALRDFFRHVVPRTPSGRGGREAFKELLCSLFALEGDADGWLAHASGSSQRQREAAAALRAFLAPCGPLLTAVAWADADGGVRYDFPSELLPERARRLIASGAAGLAVLRESLPYRGWLLEGGRSAGAGGAGPLLSLTPGRYFLFWTAHAAAKPGGKLRLATREAELPLSPPPGQSAEKGAKPVAAGAARGLLHSALHPSHSNSPARLSHPYRELLLGLLAHCAPLSAPPPPRDPSFGSFACAQSAPQLRVSGEELVAILREFWLSEYEDAAGFVPFQPPTSPAPRAGFASWAPPGEDRVAALRLLLGFLASLPLAQHPPATPTGTLRSPGRSPLPAPSPLSAPPAAALAQLCGVSPLLAQLHKPVYRLLRAAFSGCPADSQADLKPLLRLWATVLLPWAAWPRDAAPATAEGWAGVRGLPPPARDDCGGAAWGGHVDAVSPFATRLLEHFAAFACARVQVDPADAAALLDGALLALCGLGEAFLDRLRRLEQRHNELQSSGTAAHGRGDDVALALAATLEEWEGVARPAYGPQKASPRAPLAALQPAGAAAQGVAWVLQVVEREAPFCATPVRAELRQRLALCAQFALRLPPPPPPPPGAHATSGPDVTAEGFSRPGLAKRVLADRHLPPVDPWTAPVGSHEVSILVWPAVAASVWMTEALRGWGRGEGRVGAAAPARLRGWLLAQRVNLRPLAETASLAGLAVLAVAWWLLRWLLRAATAEA